MIQYCVGDATAPNVRPAIIAHICNDAGKWGAGFVLAISSRWPQPEAEYRERHRMVGSLLGSTHVVKVDGGLWVANMIAQHGTRSRTNPVPLQPWALGMCLTAVAESASILGATVVMPRIGCGLAGGTWDQIEPIIAASMADVPVNIYDLGDRDA